MSLDLKKKKVELQRVECARAELELRIEERMDEIARLEEHIKIQKDKEEELKNEIKNFK